jgi:hypothetical protein
LAGIALTRYSSIWQTTIRVLGGLLAAYHLSSRDPIYLDRATELGDRILPAFDTPSELPLSNINLGRRKGIPDPDYPALVSTAEIATLQLEFRYLSEVTGDETYWSKAERVKYISSSLPRISWVSNRLWPESKRLECRTGWRPFL